MRRIERRILEAVKRAVAFGYQPRRFYLIARDISELAACRADVHQVDGIPIRRSAAKASLLYCKNGVAVCVPKVLPEDQVG